MEALVEHSVHITFLDKMEHHDFNNYTNGILLSISSQGVEVTQDSTSLLPLWYPMMRVASIEHQAYCNKCMEKKNGR